MVNHPEVIRKQMEETRSNLTEKLESLENQVAGTVQSASEVVNDTVEAVKGTVDNVTATVHETVQSVSRTFDLRLQTEKHPWIVFGGSVALGCLAAQCLGSTPQKSTKAASREQTDGREENRARESDSPHPAKARAEPAEAGPRSWFWDELGRVKGLAVGALMGVVRDLAARGLPGTLGKRAAEEVDHLTAQLGGEPLPEPVIPTEKR